MYAISHFHGRLQPTETEIRRAAPWLGLSFERSNLRPAKTKVCVAFFQDVHLW